MDAFSHRLELQPDNAKAYYNLGSVYYKYDKTEEAISHFEKCIKINPKFSSAYHQAWLASVKKGDLQKTIKYFEDLLRLEPNAPEANQVTAMIEQLKKIERSSVMS